MLSFDQHHKGEKGSTGYDTANYPGDRFHRPLVAEGSRLLLFIL
jgi:hypothetical protein